MKISPRYEAPPIISIDGPFDDQRAPVMRQRRRLETTLVGLGSEAWSSPSRCEAWTVQDVVAHLITVDGFWRASVLAGLGGTPTRFLDGFDPAATPALMVEGTRAQAPNEVLDQFVVSNRALLAVLAELDEAGWSALAESPAGHVPIRLLAHHALWDCWVHERDITLPLGLSPAVEPDEVCSSLRYAAALSPAFALSSGSASVGVFAVDANEPNVQFTLELGGKSVSVREGPAPSGAPVLRGGTVDLVEALSIRAPLPRSAPTEWRQLLTGLATVFDQDLAS
jgi:uncharacterized protein (TIGR03083 family)